MPLPYRLCSSTKYRYSSKSISGSIGRACNKLIISFLFIKFPQTSSPIIRGWQATSPSIRRSCKSLSFFRRWSIQTEVSTRTIYFIDRRRGIAFKSFSVPPSIANRLLLSRAISASRPKWTNVVFSVTPVNNDAFFSICSFMFSVVLICISMHLLYAFVKICRL